MICCLVIDTTVKAIGFVLSMSTKLTPQITILQPSTFLKYNKKYSIKNIFMDSIIFERCQIFWKQKIRKGIKIVCDKVRRGC